MTGQKNKGDCGCIDKTAGLPHRKEAGTVPCSKRCADRRDSGKGTDFGQEVSDVQTGQPEADGNLAYKHKHRDSAEYKDLIHRLNRIEGQVRGIRNMVEDERYCVDILTQVSAIQSALNSFNKVLLTSHIKTCVIEDIKNGEDGVVEELCATLQKLMK